MNTLKYFLFVNCMLLLMVTCLCQPKDTRPEPVFPKRWTMPTELPDHIILTYSGNTSTTQSVTWRTDTTIKKGIGEIALADASPDFWRKGKMQTAKTSTMNALEVRSAEVVANYHSINFTGLLPDTLYAYRVGDGVHWSEWFQFRTASQGNQPFSFLYVGDAQNYILELWSRLIREGFKKAPNARFIIHAGDLVNDAHNERQWHEWHMAGGWLHGMLPSVPVPGNHEYRGYDAADEENKISRLSVQWNYQFALPENGPDGLKGNAYYFDYQGVRFICLNSNRMLKEQAAWMDSVLTNNPNQWTVASFHHPIFSGAGSRDNQQLRELWKPIIDKHGIDLVLTGHDHTYTRGTASPGIKNAKAGVNTRRDGTVYVVSVSGGKMYQLADSLWKNYDARLARSGENTQLFQVISIDKNKLIYQAFTATGQLYDAFELMKQKKGKNKFVEKAPANSERKFRNTN